jgi:helicase
MKPILRPRRGDLDMVETYAEERQEEFAIHVNQESGDYIERDQFLGEVKTAMVLNDWINEKTEADILEQHGVQPGDRYAAVHNAEWLLHSAHEIADIVGAPDHRRQLGELNDRVKHGVTKKLLPLIRLKGIGRIRARVLYKSGLTGIAELKRAPLQRLVALPLIGPRLAKSIKEQVGGLVEEQEWKSLDKAETEQKALTDFVEEKFEPENED